MKVRDVGVVTGFELKRMMRGPAGILFACFFLLFYLWVAFKLYEGSQEINETIEAMGALGAFGQGALPEDALAQSALFGFITWLTGLPAGEFMELLGSYPPLLLGFAFIALVGTPFFGMIGAMDQTASDLGSRHVRYLLIRTDRLTLYIGKTLANILLIALATALIVAVMAVLTLLGGGKDGVGAVLFAAAKIWLLITFFSLPFIAMMGMANAMIGHSFLSLVLGIGFYLVVWAISAIGGWGNPNLAYASYLFPTALKYQLLSPDWAAFGKAVGHQLAMTAVFFLGGLAIFRRRDV